MFDIERVVYDRVKTNPWVKQRLKWLYQLRYSIGGKGEEVRPPNLISIQGAFFGFHDKSPWDVNNSVLVAHKTSGSGNEAEATIGLADIVLFSGEGWDIERCVASTSAWNWQQGSQLQWYSDSDELVFNDFVDGLNVARTVSVDGQPQKVFDYPIGAYSIESGLAASFCFKKFGDNMRGYGYDFKEGRASPFSHDEFLLFDEFSRVTNSILGTDVDRELAEDGIGFFSHAIFSPNGQKVAFMRRFSEKSKRLRSHLFVLDVETNEIERVPFTDMVSHYTWVGDRKILAYANCPDDGFFMFDLDHGECERWSEEMGPYDGHPQANLARNLVVFDKYPNKRRLMELFTIDLKTRRRISLGSFFLPMKFWADKRVDLHPRFSRDGRQICIDFVDEGIRSLGIIDLDESDR